MLTGWMSSRAWPIGLDFGASRVRLVRLCRSPDGVRVTAAGRWDVPPDTPPDGPERHARFVDGCLGLLEQCGVRGRVEAVASLPDHAVRYKSVRMPHMPPDERAAAVEWEAADHFASEDDPVSVRHILAGDVQQGDAMRQEVILMAAAQSGVDAVMRVLDACQVSVLAVEATPTALARCFGRTCRRVGDRGEVRAFLDIGAAGAKVLILRGDRPAFYRRIEPDPPPPQQQRPATAAAAAHPPTDTPRQSPADSPGPAGRLAIPPDRLARDVALCLRYYAVTFRDKRPGVLHLCGAGANDAALPQILGEALSVDVCAAEPLSEPEASALRRRHESPPHEWAVAVGLALRRHTAASPAKRGAA